MCTISLADFVFLSVSLFLVCVSIYWSSTRLYLCFLFIRHFVLSVLLFSINISNIHLFIHLFVRGT
jgi:hypothetical protein